jgi:hypothetical protein
VEHKLEQSMAELESKIFATSEEKKDAEQGT